MKNIDILTDDDLMTEFKQKKNFIDRNSKKMGGRGRPRRFIRANVEAFLSNYYCMAAAEAREKAAIKEEHHKDVDGAARGVNGPDEVGDILGRGGRTLTRGRGDAEKGATA